ncbi:uncharacterized protein F4807DRAFT_254704 [Annulohypoxylon truncatum]|uniref:uncharacterized protein n=1 Tax=Annulohypoxylon truncatum TaxID=327061 RepID=UPI002007D081|nr:uncharacterized protein F4807DRAFT_254704 [Annulohypoxylon truncatum]KAI1205867.1 hypothetical protein F4807DRAFT_254704 [Annulohypoxylon truncatum]
MERETSRQTGRVLRSTTTRVQKSQANSNLSKHTSIKFQEQPKVPKTSKASKTLKSKIEKFMPSYLQQPDADATSDPNQDIWLFAFPREILREISSHLPPESIICLTLTCKLALRILGISSWKDTMITKRWCTDTTTMSMPRSNFRELLQRDVEKLGFVSCKACNTLHPPLKKPSEHRQIKLTKYCWGQDAIIEYLPQNEDGFGYSLVFAHIKHAMTSTPEDSNSPVDYLSGSFRVPHPNLNYTVTSSARRISRNLVLQHDYCFSPSSKRLLKAADIFDLPFRICPHQTTSTDQPVFNRYTRNSTPNGPLLIHSIVSAFPAARRVKIPKAGGFREPTVLEKRQMTSAESEEGFIFKCRSCPTKWRVRYADTSGGKGIGRDELTVSVFHCFSKELYSAATSWRWFVRREGQLLGKEKRNSEFWSVGRSYPDFKVE